MLTLRYVQKHTFRVTVERLLHHKSRTVGTPGVNLVSKCAGDTRGKSHERRARNFEWYRRTVKKTTGGAIMAPPPPGKLGLIGVMTKEPQFLKFFTFFIFISPQPHPHQKSCQAQMCPSWVKYYCKVNKSLHFSFNPYITRSHQNVVWYNNSW